MPLNPGDPPEFTDLQKLHRLRNRLDREADDLREKSRRLREEVAVLNTFILEEERRQLQQQILDQARKGEPRDAA